MKFHCKQFYAINRMRTIRVWKYVRIIWSIYLYVRISYSTEITPTPTIEWKFLHRLICLENTPTRKWCICQWAVVKKGLTVSCVSSEDSNSYSYLHASTVIRDKSLNLYWRLWLHVTRNNLLMQNLDLYTFVVFQELASDAERKDVMCGCNFEANTWMGLHVISRKNYCFRN